MLAVRSVIGAWRSAESERRSRALRKERCEWVGKGLRRCKSHPNRERERGPLPPLGKPPPCCARRSFCSIGAQTDPWRTFHGPFLGGKHGAPRTLSDIPSTAGPHSGVFPQWGNALLLYRCHWRLQFKSGTALPFWHCMGIHSLSLSLSLSLFLHGIVRSPSSKAHKPTYLHSAHTHTHAHALSRDKA